MRQYLIGSIVIALSVVWIVSCSAEKKIIDDSIQIRSTSPSSGMRGAMPNNVYVASNTSAKTPTARMIRQSSNEPDDLEGKVEQLDQALTSTTYGDCDNAIPALSLNADVVECFGPVLAYTSHPDAGSESTDISDAEFPSGDLGIWNEAESFTGEACASAQLNSLVQSASRSIDFAIGLEAMMICAAQVGEQTLPGIGKTLNVTTILADNNVGSGANITVTNALIARLANVGENPAYYSTLSGTYDIDGVENAFTMILTHIATNQENTEGKGLVTLEVLGLFDSIQAGRQYNQAASVVYEKTSDNLNLRMVSAEFEDKTDYFASDGQVTTSPTETEELDDEETDDDLATTEKSKSSKKAQRREEATWDANLNVIQVEVDSTGVGKLAFSWQAGPNDGYARIFNVETFTDVKGAAYYGYATTSDSDPSPMTIDRMICNWAGPNSDKIGVQKVQKQTLQKSESSGIWQSETSNIIYAPTNSCDWSDIADQSASFGTGTLALVFPVTSDLYDIETYKLEFILPEAPEVPETP